MTMRYGEVQRIEPRSTLAVTRRGAGNLLCYGIMASVGVAAYLLREMFGILNHR